MSVGSSYRLNHSDYDQAVSRLENHRRQGTPVRKEALAPIDTDRMDTDAIIHEAEQVAHASDAAVQRMLKTTESTKQVGAAMLSELDRQGEVLRRAQANVDRTRDIQPSAQRQVRSVASVAGQLYNEVVPAGAPKPHDTNAQVSKKQQKIDAKAASRRAKEKPTAAASSSALPPELSVLNPAAQAAVVHSETGLDELSRRVANLRQMAVTIGEEFDRQDPQLDALSKTTSSASTSISRNIQRVNDCL